MTNTNPQGRKWFLTINNPEEKNLDHEAIKDILKHFQSLVYFCMADEKGQTYHTHLFVCFRSPVRFSTIKNHFSEAHIDRAKGTSAECKLYIMKAGKWEHDDKSDTSIPGSFEESGELPIENQGERADLARLYSMIKDGMSNYEIMEANPDYMNALDKIDRARQVIREHENRDTFRHLQVTYIWGKTGTGKNTGRHGEIRILESLPGDRLFASV